MKDNLKTPNVKKWKVIQMLRGLKYGEDFSIQQDHTTDAIK